VVAASAVGVLDAFTPEVEMGTEFFVLAERAIASGVLCSSETVHLMSYAGPGGQGAGREGDKASCT
jgi:hypothetical protein